MTQRGVAKLPVQPVASRARLLHRRFAGNGTRPQCRRDASIAAGRTEQEHCAAGRRWRRRPLPGPAFSSAVPASSAAASRPDTDATNTPEVVLRPIQPRPEPLTPEGFVPSSASLAAVPPPLRPLLDRAVAVCQQELGGSLVGVYLRGSLVQEGCFLPGVSDADLLAVYVAEPAQGEGPPQRSAARRDVQARLQAAAQSLQVEFRACAKVELKAVALPAGSPLARLHRGWQQQQQQQKVECAHGGEAAAHSTNPGAAIPPSALLGHGSLAFQLKTQAACLAGWDLPTALPDVAALPQPILLPSLVEDVAAALEHAKRHLAAARSGSDAGGTSAEPLAAAVRAARWALKRCIRAVFELYLCAPHGSPSGSSSSGVGKVYSRDLYWCMRYASSQYAVLAEPLEAGLKLYLQLGSRLECLTGSSSSQDLREDATRAMRIAGDLTHAIDTLFLDQMLAEDPGWLDPHDGSQPVSLQAAHLAGLQSPAQPQAQEARMNLPADGRASATQSRGGGWAGQLRVRLWGAAAALAGGMEARLVGRPPPPVKALPVAGAVLSLDWAQPEARLQAERIIAAALQPECDEGSLSSGDIDEAATAQPQPVLLKGAAASWPAVQRWSLDFLATSGLQGRTRIAPSLHFPFTEPTLAAEAARRGGVAALPSCVATMPAWELAARLQAGNPLRLPPLVYGGHGGQPGTEFHYFQGDLPPRLLRHVDLSLPPFQPPLEAGGRRRRQSQAGRVWVSPQGAVSPTHYDLAHSFLAQIRGRKRMLFWSPDALPALYPYPDHHLLRRRSRIPMHAPAHTLHERFPLMRRAGGGREALLEPGDVVFFPPGWAHYTESLDFSVSVTCRFG